MNALFHTAPVGLAVWVPILGVRVAGYIAVEIDKAVRRRSDARRMWGVRVPDAIDRTPVVRVPHDPARR